MLEEKEILKKSYTRSTYRIRKSIRWS